MADGAAGQHGGIQVQCALGQNGLIAASFSGEKNMLFSKIQQLLLSFSYYTMYLVENKKLL